MSERKQAPQTRAEIPVGALALYDTACRALAEAVRVDEVKDVHDRAVALAAYARQAKNRDLEADAVEIRMRATRRLDQLRVAQKETVGLNTGTRGQLSGGLKINPPGKGKPTLASQGIDKNLAQEGRMLGALSDEKFEQVIVEARGHGSRAVQRAVRETRIREKRASFSLETPQPMLPTPTGRRMRVARNPAKRQWLLAIGPSISSAALAKKEQAARETPLVRRMQKAHDEMLSRADALEAKAKALRNQAKVVEDVIFDHVRKFIGPVAPFTETYDFQCDEETDAVLAALPQPAEGEHQLVERLLAARGTKGGGLAEIKRGYWGSMMHLGLQMPTPGPGAWTSLGSPEWLAEMFPHLREPEQTPDQAPELSDAVSERRER